MDIRLGDKLTMKKAHPCGSKQWLVLRVGMDFRLRCCGCGHEVMIARSKAEKISVLWKERMQYVNRWKTDAYSDYSGRDWTICDSSGGSGAVRKDREVFRASAYAGLNREYTLYTGMLDGVQVGVCSTGIGGPSAAIALEELVECGADTFIRVGTSGGMQDDVLAGDICIATASIRQEGTSREYLPIEFPAAAHFDVVLALRDAAAKLGYRYHTGVIQSKDSFYGELRPDRQAVADELHFKWKAWKAGGADERDGNRSAVYCRRDAGRTLWRGAQCALECRQRHGEYNCAGCGRARRGHRGRSPAPADCTR